MRMTEAIGKGTGLLAFGGIDRKGRDARLLLAHALGVTPDRLVLEVHRDITETEWQTYHAFLTRRLDHEPVSRIIGARAFWGRDFKIAPEVLDPRPETEVLIAALLTAEAPRRVLDLGCGSGILAVTLAAEWPGAQVLATDISARALDITQDNARRHGVSDRVAVALGDWFAPVADRFDLIVSNPPYIAADEMDGLARDVRDYDPRIALTDEADGFSAYRAILAGAADHLTEAGRLMVEIGWQQGEAVRALFAAAGFADVQLHRDLDNRDRAVSAIWPGRGEASG